MNRKRLNKYSQESCHEAPPLHQARHMNELIYVITAVKAANINDVLVRPNESKLHYPLTKSKSRLKRTKQICDDNTNFPNSLFAKLCLHPAEEGRSKRQHRAHQLGKWPSRLRSHYLLWGWVPINCELLGALLPLAPKDQCLWAQVQCFS